MDFISIDRGFIEEMLSHAGDSAPAEACGILAGRAGKVERLFRMTNVEGSPVSYFMDAKEQFKAMKLIREDGLEMVAIYHSHPAGGAYPSPKDISLASYPDSAYVIIALGPKPEIKAYMIEEGNVREIGIRG